MQYLILIFWAGLATALLALIGIKTAGLKRLFLQKIITDKIIGKPYFSTLAVRESVNYILKQPREKRQKMLQLISQNKLSGLRRLIDLPNLKLKLRLMTEGKLSTLKTTDALYLMMKTDFLLKTNLYNQAEVLVGQLNNLTLKTRGLQAFRHYLLSRIALMEGDMLSASEEASSALKGFQKENMVFEEAQTYFVLGTTYRISGVFDSAEFMLRSALELFRVVKAAEKQAEVLGNLGLLAEAQKRFDEAESYFAKAQKILADLPLQPGMNFIICQQALLNLLRGEVKVAQKTAKHAFKISQTAAEQALAAEILARCSYAQKDWKTTAKFAKTAAENYLKENNNSSYFENLYLLAEAQNGLEKFDEAELTLRNLIQKASLHKSCFHIANAYTLLGLILLRQEKPKNAKVFFNKALEQELFNDRPKGAAIDYANLAVLEKKCGNLEAAHQNLENALIYAKDTDEELYQKIRASLN